MKINNICELLLRILITRILKKVFDTFSIENYNEYSKLVH
ncbi:hypothetical protein J2S74_000522 [Evansella vedderi]|uniref:Uncharacterized protein n=1 Tax=Evansella vedderi TaxID=38282 RepID=A0ABT9ZSJ6_9BACI|nr:hypothetical protein [Evansella vedderi]